MINYHKVSTLVGDRYPDLEVCSNNGSPLSVLQWQPSGEISIDSSFGVKLDNSLFIDKARGFINLAKSQNCSLALTPEYSFPYQVLDEIVMNNGMWPPEGKLWCLGTQGESRAHFIQKMQHWATKSEVITIQTALSRLENRSFVSPLIFLFRDIDGRLVIIPQFKTGPMADPRNAFEGPGLCCGSDIFIFESVNTESWNVFLSIICADASHINQDNLIAQVSRKKVILFHPQLNPEPRHDDFVGLRQKLLGLSNEEFRIITLNWAEGTLVRGDGNLIPFNKPWSAFFKDESGTVNDNKFRR